MTNFSISNVWLAIIALAAVMLGVRVVVFASRTPSHDTGRRATLSTQDVDEARFVSEGGHEPPELRSSE